MSDFLKSTFNSSSSSPPPDMAARKQAMMDQIKNELALANAQELINKINDKCYQKCITKPGSSLSGSDETCLTQCMDRYMEAFNIVSRTYVNRLGRERQTNPGGFT